MKKLTFREVVAANYNEIIKKEGVAGLSDIAYEMRRANRCYIGDNLDPYSKGNYLDDFLREHGDEVAVPIKFCLGGSKVVGRGIVIDLG